MHILRTTRLLFLCISENKDLNFIKTEDSGCRQLVLAGDVVMMVRTDLYSGSHLHRHKIILHNGVVKNGSDCWEFWNDT